MTYVTLRSKKQNIGNNLEHIHDLIALVKITMLQKHAEQLVYNIIFDN